MLRQRFSTSTGAGRLAGLGRRPRPHDVVAGSVGQRRVVGAPVHREHRLAACCQGTDGCRADARAARSLGILGPGDFDTCPEFWGGVASGTPAPQLCRQCPDQPLWSGTAGRMVAGLWRSGRRRSADHDRRSWREHAHMQAGQRKVQVSGDLGGLRRSLSGRDWRKSLDLR